MSATDEGALAEHGYAQRLSRNLGSFSTFAAGFSVISILTGTFGLFGFGYGFGGPLIVWAWLAVFAGQLCVALVFCELGARFPLSGAVYQWARKVGRPGPAWFGGWVMVFANILSIAGVAVAFQTVLPSVWSGFQVFENSAQNAVFLGCLATIATCILNLMGVRVMSRINNLGVFVELLGVIAIIGLFFLHAHNPVSSLVTSQGAGPDAPGWNQLGYLAPMLMAALVPAWVLFGFDTAGDLAEETVDPQRRTPRAILRAVTASGVGGFLLMIGAVLAAPSLDREVLGAGGLPAILESVAGSGLGKFLLADVAVAIFACQLAIQTAVTRLLFSLARDGQLPFSPQLAHVTHNRHTPVAAILSSGAIAMGMLLINIGNPQIFVVVTGVATAFAYIAYLFITSSTFLARLKGWPGDRGSDGLFYMGNVRGKFVNAVAVLFGASFTLSLLWPREETYGAGVYRFGGLVVVGVVVVIGSWYYLTVIRKRGVVIDAQHKLGAQSAAEPSQVKVLEW